MAFAAILRKSDPSLAWLARVNRNQHSAIFTASSNLSWSSFVPIFGSLLLLSLRRSPVTMSHLSNSLTRKSSVLWRREIGRSECGFPFKIEDIPGQQTIILTREYQDEVVKIEVSMLDLDSGEEIDLSFRKSETSKDEMPYGPDFRDLDENLKNALCGYLEIRGIEPTTTHLMFELILNKDSNGYLLWLKSVKNFIEA
ncbi:hypothetical protein EZV62_026339 [Acer yangbiense]|uniref:Mitochondrial glycoprotein domain-containing protein n=1 Tax=Acer yangbiense TaxID=1000413 RepID=A0A5C7GR72_9ROSI|nr:hypothetical protein EZV62_026339 [Acer yangbiense]